MLSDWLKTQKKPTRTNQIRDVLTTKIQENGHGFQQTTATIEKLKKIFQKPEHSKKYVFLAKCIEKALLRKNTVNKIEENEPEKLENKLLITDYAKVKK